MRIAGKVTMVTVALAAAAALSACAPNEQDSTRSTNATTPPPPPSSVTTRPTTTAATTPATTGAATPAAGECKVDDVKVEGAANAKPTITIPSTCKMPTTLLMKDLTPGTGPAVTATSNLSVNYLLETWSDKNIVDNSFDRGEPLPVENLGQAQLITGWKQGLIGAKEGGRRLLIIPADLGYGPNGRAPIKGNETLIFVVDTLKVS
jgi:peptidylprolyl isomerase